MVLLDSVQPESIFYATLILVWITYLWDLYLNIRQRKIYMNVKVIPNELSQIFDQDTFDKARFYNLDTMNFGIVKEAFSQILMSVYIWVFALKFFWDIAGGLLAKFNYDSSYEILQSCTCMFIMSFWNTIIGLPFGIYKTFVLEEKHGFNKQTPVFFFKDKVKSFFVSEAISTPIVAAIIYIIKMGGDYFFVYLWLFTVVIMLVLMTIYPDFIAPLFDHYELLSDGDLKSGIEKLAASLEFPLTKVYVVEGSKRSAHSNAYFYGIYKNKRIVLFDTLLKDYKVSQAKDEDEKESEKEKAKGCTNEEVLGVLSHELGHWYLNHNLKNIIITQVNLFLMFAMFSVLYKNSNLYEAFGFVDTHPVFVGLHVVLQVIFLPYNQILGFLMTILSRKFEFEADQFSKRLGRVSDLKKALIKLNLDNLNFPVFDWLFSTWHHSHPSLLERIHALEDEPSKSAAEVDKLKKYE